MLVIKNKIQIIMVLAVLVVFITVPLATNARGIVTLNSENSDPPLDASEVGDDLVFSSGNLTVIFEGKTPHIKFLLAGDDDNGSEVISFYKIMFASLNESSPSGEQVNFYRLERVQWNHSDVLITDTVLNVNFTATLEVLSGLPPQNTEVPVEIQSYMYRDTTDVEFGNETVTVPSGSFKFNLELGSWPFAAENNTLTFSINLISNLEASLSHDNETGRVDGVDTNGVTMTIENTQTAILDDVQENITTGLVSEGGMTFLSYHFSHFTESLVYDPVLSI
ncbi:MAG: hypothetical protein ACTSRU_07185, partial [Candidatus Hodarchaeales archaeon]